MYILITNFHSIKNKGDLGIVVGLMQALEDKYTNVRFGIVGKRIEEREWWAGKGVDFFTPLLSSPRSGSKVSAILFCLRYFISLFNGRYLLTDDEKNKTYNAYKKADIIVSKGGSFFREPNFKINLLPVGILGHLHQLLVGKKMYKPVVLSAQSFGPIDNIISKIILKKAFNGFDLITVRDNNSGDFLRKELGINKDIHTVGDSAFLLKTNFENTKDSTLLLAEEDKKQGKKCVGLTVRYWPDKKEFDTYIKVVSDFIDDYSKKNYVFYLMPQVTGPSKVEDDRITSREVYNRVSDNQKRFVRFVENEIEIIELQEMYKKMDYFIATRLHSAIFSLLMEVPVMTIGYEPKSQAIFNDLGIGNYVIDIRNISLNQIKQTFESLIIEPRETFYSAKTRAISLAKKNIDLLSRLIDKIK